MNLFLIPSWYPSRLHPINGIFVREQAEVIAEICNDISVIVSNWTRDNVEVPILHPIKSLLTIRSVLSEKHDKVLYINNVCEIYNPVFIWNKYFPGGGWKRLLKVNKQNIDKAREIFGEIDIIHAHVSYPGGYIANILSREYGIPYIITEHMSPFPFSNLVKNGKCILEIEKALSEASATIAVSPSHADDIEKFGFERPIIIPNLVNEKLFNHSEVKNEKFIFFTLANQTQQKGIDILLKAIAVWNPPVSQVEFKIGGDGPMRSEYEKLSAKLKIDDRVKWIGAINREDAPMHFKECNVFILPSRHESFGIVLIEALSCGKPIITTKCGGPEYIVNRDNGLIINVDDVYALAEAMNTMYKNIKGYNSEIIRNDVLRKYSRGKVVEMLKSVYLKVSSK